MLRTRAVVSLLTEEIAGLAPDPAENEDSIEPYIRSLERAERRCRWVVALDWIAIATLFLTRDREVPFLVIGRTESAVISVAILVVAVHSGARLAECLSLRRIRHACSEIASR